MPLDPAGACGRSRRRGGNIPGMIRLRARAMLLAGLALSYGAMALASGSDRDAIRNLTAEPTITPLAAHAWLQQARLALANRQPDAALAAYRAAGGVQPT